MVKYQCIAESFNPWFGRASAIAVVGAFFVCSYVLMPNNSYKALQRAVREAFRPKNGKRDGDRKPRQS